MFVAQPRNHWKNLENRKNNWNCFTTMTTHKKIYIKPCATAEAEAVPDVLMGVKWEWTFDDSKSLQAQVWKQTTKWASGYTSESTMKLV